MRNILIKKPGEFVRQFSVMLENRVGSFTSLLGLLQSRGIVCLGCGIQDGKEVSIARMVVSDPYATLEVFVEKGISFHTCEVLVVILKQGAADMQECLDKLFRAEINVNFMYALLPVMKKTMLVLHVEDVPFAAEVLNKAGFCICRQQDLSR